MSFAAPGWFWALVALPVLAALFVRAERRSVQRLRDFASTRLLPQLTGTVKRFRRGLRFGLQLLALGLAIIGLAQPRWGYTFEDVKRKGIDLLVAVDTSRSMLSNDVQPNRLERVKLATHDLVNQLQGDRVGLIAFAGRAFVQAPLTIDYDAVIETIHDLDTKTIPEGGSNISEAIALANRTYGKSAVGNRALVVFTDGEELSGDAVKTAKAAADAGVRIFTIGVGTPEGSLIPVSGEDGATAFVKDANGRVVKSKLDEKRLRQIGETTGGFYLHLENGPRTMQQLFKEGLAKMQAGEIDVRLSRRPIDRYEWPLSAALAVLAMSMLIRDRKRARAVARRPVSAPVSAAAVILLSLQPAFATVPGLQAYRDGKFNEAYQEFQQTLKAHPNTKAVDKLQFDSGAAAYKMKDYSKALESFSQALLSPDAGLQSKSHYNLGNTLYERGQAQQGDEKKLADWSNALEHYEQTLKLDPKNKQAKDNHEYVKKKIEELKNKKEQPQPSPPPQNQKNDKKDKKNEEQQKDQSKQQQQSSQQDQQQQKQEQNNQQQSGQQDQKQQSQSQNEPGDSQKEDSANKQDQSQAKNEQQKKEQPKAGETPSPTPGTKQPQEAQPSPSPGDGKNEKDRQDSPGDREQPSPSPGGDDQDPSPSPSEGEGSGEGAQSSPAPAETPKKKLAGEIKGAAGEEPEKPSENDTQVAEAELEKDGQMSERQAEALLQSMKGEEARVHLDERRTARRVYNDW